MNVTAELLNAWLPVFLPAIGGLIALTASGLGFLIRSLWNAHKKETEVIAKGLELLAEQMSITEQSITSLRAELFLSTQKMDGIKGGLLGLEGEIKAQRATIQTHIEKIVRVETKLEAVFRFIDAPNRVTDNRR